MSQSDLTVALLLKADAAPLKQGVEQAAGSWKRAVAEMGQETRQQAAVVATGLKEASAAMAEQARRGASKASAAWKEAAAKVGEQSRITAAEVNDSWKDLGVRPIKAVVAEIERMQGAYDTLRYSGRMTLEDLARAEEALAVKTAKLRQEMAVPMADGKALQTLGIRSTATIEAEIAALKNAYQQLAVSGAVSLQELGRAEEALAVKTALLRKEMGSSFAGDAFKTLGMRSTATIEAEIAALNASYRALARSGTVSLQDLGRASDALKRKTAQLTAEMDGAKSSAHGLGGAVKSMIAAFAVMEVVHFGQAVVHTELALQGARNTLATLTGSARAGAQEFEWLVGMASRVGISLEEAAKGYSRWVAASQTARLTVAETRQLFEQLAAGFARTGSTSVETARAIHTLIEIMEEGEFGSRLMKQFGREAPAMFNFLSLAIQETDGSLRQVMMRFGEIASRIPDGGLEGARKSFAGLHAAIQLAQDTIAKGGLMEALESVANKITDKGNGAHDTLTVIGRDLGLLVNFLALLAEAFTAPIVQFGLATLVVYKFIVAIKEMKLALSLANPATLLASLATAAAGYVLLQSEINEVEELKRKTAETDKSAEKSAEKSAYARTNLLAAIAGEEKKLAELRHELHAEEMREEKKQLDEKLRGLEAELRATEQTLKAEEKIYQDHYKALEDARKTTRLDKEDTDHRLREIKRRGMSDREAEGDRAEEVAEQIQKARVLGKAYKQAVRDGDWAEARKLANEQKRLADEAMRGAEGLKNVQAAYDGFKLAAAERANADKAWEQIEEVATEAAKSRVESLSEKYRQQAAEVEAVAKQVDKLHAAIQALEPSKTVEIHVKIDAAEKRLAELRRQMDELEKRSNSQADNQNAIEAQHNNQAAKADAERSRQAVEADAERSRQAVEADAERSRQAALEDAAMQKILRELLELSKIASARRQAAEEGRTIDGYASGGMVGAHYLATGGRLSGYGGGDIIPAMLEPGEFVLRKEAVQRYGSGMLAALNDLRLPHIEPHQVRGLSRGGLIDNLVIPQISAPAAAAVGAGVSGHHSTIQLMVGERAAPAIRTDRQTAEAVTRFFKEQMRTR
ncbi:MAG: hypothetical protein HQM06_16700 [Magnetococcales bacterium]|nr:hypothetical protein [Magnetococcales bacterium]